MLARNWPDALNKCTMMRRAGCPGVLPSSPEPPTLSCARKADVRLPGKGNSNLHGARPVNKELSLFSCAGGAATRRPRRLRAARWRVVFAVNAPHASFQLA